MLPEPVQTSNPAVSGSSRSATFVPRLKISLGRISLVDAPKPKDVDWPAFELRFDYEGTIIRPEHDDPLSSGGGVDFDSGGDLSFCFDDGASGNPEVPRDHQAEARVQCLLESFGLLDLSCVDDILPAYGSEADYVLATDNVHSICSFMANAVPQLRKLGWEVEVDESFPYHVIGGDVPWYASVDPSEEEERADWFSLELGIDVGGQRVNLLPGLLDLLENTSEGSGLDALMTVNAKFRALAAGENRYVTLPPERLRRLLGVLMDLYRDAEGRSADKEHLDFQPDQSAALIGEIDELLGSSEGRVRWEGASDVAERARTLIDGPIEVTEPVGLKATLRHYQHDGLTWMQHLRLHNAGGVLADDMGLGKTLQTIAHLAKEKEGQRTDLPSLVLLPTSLVGNWQREIERFAPHLRVLTIHGPKRHKHFPKVPQAEVVLTTYPLILRDLDQFTEHDYHYVILDEAQAIKNPRSRVGKAVRELTSRHRLCLTGTPVENNLEELWSLFDFLIPGLLGDAARFRSAYRLPIERDGSEPRLASLRKRVSPFILRRMKETVATELPPKTELVRSVELENDQRELYESIRVAAHSQVRTAIRKKGFAASTIAILDALMRLRQVCCDPRLVRGDAARKVEHSAKLSHFMELARTQLGQGRRILVFSQFTRMLGLISQALGAEGIGHIILTGASQNRQDLCDRFESKEVDVFLISLKAGGTGLNLTSADTVIHYDPWWNAAAQAQATDRAYRIGQKKPVFVYNLIVSGSVEERILRLQQRKRHLADVILGDGGEKASGMTLEDLDDLLAPLDEE